MNGIDWKADHCPECHRAFWQQDTGRPRRYCSNACKQKAYRRDKAAVKGKELLTWAKDYLARVS